jgi:SnoaL-like domain
MLTLASEPKSERHRERDLTEIEHLITIEEIKQLKAKYLYCVDTKNWESKRKFTEARSIHAPDDGDKHADALSKPIVGIDKFIALVQGVFATPKSMMHHGDMPQIDIASPDTALGV